jgi:putative ABC transport system substrate-binding protein
MPVGSKGSRVPDAFTDVYREQIIALAARHCVPTIYGYRYFTAAGGLISYGVNSANTYRQAATYVDRILKGEKPADLPVQFELVVKLGLDVPLHLQQLADEVIE